MIHRHFTEDIEITPRELVRELWEMDDVKQTDFLLALSQIYKNDFYNFIIQCEYLKDTVHSELTEEERYSVVTMLKTLIEYLESEE